MTAATSIAPARADLPKQDLIDLLKRCAPSEDRTREHLCSIRFEGGQAISTDGHRIHCLPAPFLAPDMTVPTWALLAALDSIVAENTGLVIEPDGKRVRVRTSAGEIIAKQPEFPPRWRDVYPGRSVAGGPRIVVDLPIARAQRELRRLAKAGAGVALGGVSVPTIKDGVFEDVLRFTARTDLGRPVVDAPTPWDAPAPEVWNGEIGFQVRYLLEAIAAAKWSHKIGGRTNVRTAQLGIYGPLDPAILSWWGGEAVIMPMRL